MKIKRHWLEIAQNQLNNYQSYTKYSISLLKAQVFQVVHLFQTIQEIQHDLVHPKNKPQNQPMTSTTVQPNNSYQQSTDQSAFGSFSGWFESIQTQITTENSSNPTTPFHFKVLPNALQQILTDHRHVSLTLTSLGKRHHQSKHVNAQMDSAYSQLRFILPRTNDETHSFKRHCSYQQYLLNTISTSLCKKCNDVLENLFISLANLSLTDERLSLSFSHVELFENFSELLLTLKAAGKRKNSSSSQEFRCHRTHAYTGNRRPRGTRITLKSNEF